MSQKFIQTPDGPTCPDDLIPRVMRFGFRPMMPDPHVPYKKRARYGNPRFEARVHDAILRLRAGETHAEIREAHGGAVLREALADMKDSR